MQVYLDNAATTPLDKKVLRAMEPYMKDQYGNPSSFHFIGKQAADAIEQARKSVADILHVRADEIVFCSGGTESDNLALLGVARANQEKGKHVITTAVEHHAVLECTEQLECEGFEVTYLKPDEYGQVSVKQVIDAVRDDTILISIIYVNNEIGTINPIAEIGNAIQKLRQEKGSVYPLFHSDACQATGYLDLNVERIHVDLLTLNGSKMYGPKGAGILYAKRGIKIAPLMFGGSQEKGLRPGTENVAGIIGLAEALKIAQKDRVKESERLCGLRDYLADGILKTISKTRLNGHPENRLPNNVNISFMDIEGEALVLYLDAAGIYVSTGSACTSASLDPSHVILALGLPFEAAHGSVRFSLGRSTTKKQIDYVLKKLPDAVDKLRVLSPVNVDEKHF
ncbi:MAG: cysteine desulfurase family protein [Patescibacteria group bacterium]